MAVTTGRYFVRCRPAPAHSDASNPETTGRFFARSEELTGTSFRPVGH